MPSVDETINPIDSKATKTCIGLSLVKAIADLHGLSLHFADHGSVVSLVGPALAH